MAGCGAALCTGGALAPGGVRSGCQRGAGWAAGACTVGGAGCWAKDRLGRASRPKLPTQINEARAIKRWVRRNDDVIARDHRVFGRRQANLLSRTRGLAVCSIRAADACAALCRRTLGPGRRAFPDAAGRRKMHGASEGRPRPASLIRWCDAKNDRLAVPGAYRGKHTGRLQAGPGWSSACGG